MKLSKEKITEVTDNVFASCCAVLNIDLKSVNANICFLSSRKMKKINLQFRNTNRVTDVLSFPSLNIKSGTTPELSKFATDINPETNKLELGDILICVKKAKQQSKEYGHSLERELAFLYLHGLLHLLGYDHMNEQDETKMNNISEKVLQKAGYSR